MTAPHDLTDEQLMRIARRSYVAGVKNPRWAYLNVWPLGVDEANFYQFFNPEHDALTIIVNMTHRIKETIHDRTAAAWCSGFARFHEEWDRIPGEFERFMEESIKRYES